MKKHIINILLLALLPTLVFAQDSLKTRTPLSEIIAINGYIKNMQTMSFQSLDDVGLDNLIHNRINIKAYLSDEITLGVGMRNRVIYGDQVKAIPNYGTALSQDNGLLDLSWTLVNKEAFVMHSTIDRLYLDFVKDNVEVRIGRQRINWGLALAWNPNDLFNTYNFIDFDYEERPGTDAVRGQYYFKNGMSSLEIAANINYQKKNTTALMYRFNKAGYDFQVLAGKYLDDVALGAGWAGNLGNVGFKGELTYFKPFQNEDKSQEAFVGTVTLDYSLPNSLYLNGAYLYSSNGITEPINLEDASLLGSFGNLTAKSLFPTQSATFVTMAYPLNPLWNLSLAGMYGFGMNLAFISPNISYSIRDDMEAILVGQTFFLEQNSEMKALSNGMFFRLKWSF